MMSLMRGMREVFGRLLGRVEVICLVRGRL